MVNTFWTIAEWVGRSSPPSPHVNWHILTLFLLGPLLAYIGEPVPTLLLSAVLAVVALLLPFHGAYAFRHFWRASRRGLALLVAITYLALGAWLLRVLASSTADLLAA